MKAEIVNMLDVTHEHGVPTLEPRYILNRSDKLWVDRDIEVKPLEDGLVEVRARLGSHIVVEPKQGNAVVIRSVP